MKFYLGLVVLAIVLMPCNAQGKIDYSDKLISKEIKKGFNIDDFNLNEIKLRNENPVQGKYFTVSDNVSQTLGYCYIGRVNSCRAGGCSISGEIPATTSFEFFDYLIIYDTLKSVVSVRVFNYQATHGQQVCSKGWLKQFIGYQGERQLHVGKDIDAISGATISVYALTINIELITSKLQEFN